MLKRSVAAVGDRTGGPRLDRRRRWLGSVAAVVAVVSAGSVVAPAAFADSVTNFKDAMATARGKTSCGRLHYNPIVKQAAEIVNKSSDAYINHTATHVPISDPLPGLQDLGYDGNKAALLQGAHRNVADAIKGALLEGHAAIPDCSYTDFGVNVMRNEATGYNMAVAVLAGP